MKDSVSSLFSTSSLFGDIFNDITLLLFILSMISNEQCSFLLEIILLRFKTTCCISGRSSGSSFQQSN